MANQEHSVMRSTTVLVQDRTGMEICNAYCTCANRWIVPSFNYAGSTYFFMNNQTLETVYIRVNINPLGVYAVHINFYYVLLWS